MDSARGPATFVCVDEPLIEYRQHANNMSRSTALLKRDSVAGSKAFVDPGRRHS